MQNLRAGNLNDDHVPFIAIVEPMGIVADYGVFNHSYNQLRPRVD